MKMCNLIQRLCAFFCKKKEVITKQAGKEQIGQLSKRYPRNWAGVEEFREDLRKEEEEKEYTPTIKSYRGRDK